jgi:hypothetical protein
MWASGPLDHPANVFNAACAAVVLTDAPSKAEALISSTRDLGLAHFDSSRICTEA